MTEATGRNDGEPYRTFMKPYGYGRVPWCALAVKGTLANAGVETQGLNATAISAVSRHITLRTDSAVVWWKPRAGGTGHVGIIETWPAYSDYFYSLEGNYQDSYTRVKRLKSIVQRKADWVGAMTGQNAPPPPPKLKPPKAPKQRPPVPNVYKEKDQTRLSLLAFAFTFLMLYRYA